MNRQDLFESMSAIDEDILERSERNKRRHRRPRWLGAVAAVLVLAILGTAALRTLLPGDGAVGIGKPPENPLVTTVSAIAEPDYPAMAQYPLEQDYHDPDPAVDEQLQAEYSLAWGQWREDMDAQRQPEGYADGLEPFFADTMGQLLAGPAGENRVCSPLNVYLVLAMLAEITDGQSRRQILDLLGTDDMETLRTQADAVWNGQYRDDGITASVLASSLWLNEQIDFVPETMERLADTYHAAAYQGVMGSDEMNEALRGWLSDQTRGVLQGQTGDVTLSDDTVLALATTLYFQAKWEQEFPEGLTAPGAFHGPTGDVTCDFLQSGAEGDFYWGERFTAVSLRLASDSGSLWLVLPDEGDTVEDLLEDDEAMAFLLADGDWANQKTVTVHLSMPKFDVSSTMDLREDLQALGITDVFDSQASDFSPMTTDMEGIYVSQARHDVRLSVDEQGVTGAAAVILGLEGAGGPPEEEVYFTLDRPFLFTLTSADGLPLFAGTVQQP